MTEPEERSLPKASKNGLVYAQTVMHQLLVARDRTSATTAMAAPRPVSAQWRAPRPAFPSGHLEGYSGPASGSGTGATTAQGSGGTTGTGGAAAGGRGGATGSGGTPTTTGAGGAGTGGRAAGSGGATTTTTASCARCADVLGGASKEADLCWNSKATYTGLVGCACKAGSCDADCGFCKNPPEGISSLCGNCLMSICQSWTNSCVDDV